MWRSILVWLKQIMILLNQYSKFDFKDTYLFEMCFTYLYDIILIHLYKTTYYIICISRRKLSIEGQSKIFQKNFPTIYIFSPLLPCCLQWPWRKNSSQNLKDKNLELFFSKYWKIIHRRSTVPAAAFLRVFKIIVSRQKN